MSVLKAIDDRGATVAWSPSTNRPSLLVVGTKGGAMTFEDSGGDIELYDLNFQSHDTAPTLLGKGALGCLAARRGRRIGECESVDAMFGARGVAAGRE